MSFNFSKVLVVFLSFAIFFNFLYTPKTSAQVPAEVLDPLTLESSPQIPQPNSSINFFIDSHNIDLNNSRIIWTVNGKEELNSRGGKTFKTTAPDIGKKMTVLVNVTTEGGSNYSKSITLTPAEVDILWETDGYTPPFYKGRALYINEGSITLTAEPQFKTPDGKMINPNDIVYKWKNGSIIIGESSGRGMRSITIQGNKLLRPIEITVEAYANQYGLSAEKAIVFEPQKSDVVFYEESPLYGILWNKTLGGVFNLANTEIQIKSELFNFSANDVKNNKINYSWSINGTEYAELYKSTSVILKPKEGTGGTSNISVKATNENRIFQIGENEIGIKFTEKNNSLFE